MSDSKCNCHIYEHCVICDPNFFSKHTVNVDEHGTHVMLTQMKNEDKPAVEITESDRQLALRLGQLVGRYTTVGLISKYEQLIATTLTPERQRVKELEKDKANLELALDIKARELVTHRENQRGNYWAWQGDGNDHLETISAHCPVLISAKQLMELLSTAPNRDEKGDV